MDEVVSAFHDGLLVSAWLCSGLVYRAEVKLCSLEAVTTPSPAGGLAERLHEDLTRYVHGEAVEFGDIAVEFSNMTEFTRSCLEQLRGVTWGKTIAYGELARQIGRPTAARAVGQAMGKNPIPVIIPCHRVLAAHGPGGFGAGLDVKRTLLSREGVQGVF